MLEIEKYLQSKILNSDIHIFERINEQYNQAIDFFGSKYLIPLKIEKQIISGIYYDYIDESLKTHNYKKLEQTLYKHFNNDIIGFDDVYSNYSSDKKMFVIAVKNNSNVIDNKLFNNIINFYNYKLREIQSFNKYKLLYVEPIYPDIVNDFVYNKCNGKCLHLTDSNSANIILKTGLRLRNPIYANIPLRIYLLGEDKKYTISELKTIANEFCNTYKIHKYGLSILEIDLNKLSKYRWINFYKDSASKLSNAVFCVQSIPKELINKIDYET